MFSIEQLTSCEQILLLGFITFYEKNLQDHQNNHMKIIEVFTVLRNFVILKQYFFQEIQPSNF